MGGTLPASRRKRRKAPLHSDPSQCALARGRPRPSGASRGQQRDSYPRTQIPPAQGAPRSDKAVLAVAASLLTAAYHMLKYGVGYRDLGPNHFDRDKRVQADRLLRRLKALGVEVIVKPAA